MSVKLAIPINPCHFSAPPYVSDISSIYCPPLVPNTLAILPRRDYPHQNPTPQVYKNIPRSIESDLGPGRAHSLERHFLKKKKSKNHAVETAKTASSNCVGIISDAKQSIKRT